MTWQKKRCGYEDPMLRALPPWPLSEGEVHHFYWFIQGSIMDPGVRRRLRQAWGFCARHAWGGLAVEMAYRNRFVMGPAILYEDLISNCVDVLPALGSFKSWRFAQRVQSKGPCIMCDMKTFHASRGVADEEVIERGKGTESLREFALEHRTYWKDTVCGICGHSDSEVRCRRHFIENAASLDATWFERQSAMLRRISDHLIVFNRSFVWETRKTEGPRDRAALLSAIGWLSGWNPLLTLTEPRWPAIRHQKAITAKGG